MREVCFCEETHFSFIYTSYFYVLLAGPKEPKGHGRVKMGQRIFPVGGKVSGV